MTPHRTHYTIKAHPTRYKGILFRSRLEARWAAFFDLVNWEWHYEPFDLPGWTPDFLVRFRCGHSDCGSHHTLLVEVKPYFRLAEFAGHPALKYPFGGFEDDSIPADASAAFGINPDVTYWAMAHGAGGGDECVRNWVDDDYGGPGNSETVWRLWHQAGEIVRFLPR